MEKLELAAQIASRYARKIPNHAADIINVACLAALQVAAVDERILFNKIRQAILTYLEGITVVRLPRSAYKKGHRIHVAQYSESEGYDPEEEFERQVFEEPEPDDTSPMQLVDRFDIQDHFSPLTERERVVAQKLYDGFSCDEVATELNTSRQTVHAIKNR